MEATYWNNTEWKALQQLKPSIPQPYSLTTEATPCSPPASISPTSPPASKGTLVADRDETLNMIYNNDDGLRIIINGDTVHNRWKTDPLDFRERELPVKKGRKYDIEVDYMQLEDDATLNFDIMRTRR